MVERRSAHRKHLRDGFPGERMIVLPTATVAAATRGDQQLGILPSDVGYFPSANYHAVQRPKGVDQLILIYCVAGSGWAVVGGRSVVITPGQVLIIGRERPHAYGATDDQPWTIHWIHLAGRSCDAVEQALAGSGDPLLIDLGEDAELSRLFEGAFRILCEASVPRALLRASLAAAGILERLIDARRRMDGEDEVRDRITRVIHFMWRRVNARVTLGELASIAGLSTSHLAVSFKKHAGLAPIDYFHRLQMQQAAHLLSNTTLPIKAVSARLGFHDQLYFSRRFRKFHGVSPTQYRGHSR